MPGMTKQLQKLVHRATEFITNAQANATVAEKMAAYGYDAERWAEGQALLDAAINAARANETAYAEQLGRTDDYKAAFDKAWEQAQALARLSAELFAGQTELLVLMGLHKRRDADTGESEIAWPRQRNLVEFLTWARALYGTAEQNDEVAKTLGNFGYPAERLSAEAADVQTLAQADSAQEIAKAEMQQSTVERDETEQSLKEWLRKGETVAKLALKDKRQLLELMGLRAQRR